MVSSGLMAHGNEMSNFTARRGLLSSGLYHGSLCGQKVLSVLAVFVRNRSQIGFAFCSLRTGVCFIEETTSVIINDKNINESFNIGLKIGN